MTYRELVRDTIEFIKADGDKPLLVSREAKEFFQAAPPKPKMILREEPPTPAPVATTGGVKDFLQKKGVAYSSPVDDSEAKKLASAWKVKALAKPVVILSFGQVGVEAQFLLALAKAIDERLLPATVVDGIPLEKEKNWSFFLQATTLKWIIAPPVPFSAFPEYAQFYKNTPTTGMHTLGNLPLILLARPTDYIQNPALKAELWKLLCSNLKLPQ